MLCDVLLRHSINDRQKCGSCLYNRVNVCTFLKTLTSWNLSEIRFFFGVFSMINALPSAERVCFFHQSLLEQKRQEQNYGIFWKLYNCRMLSQTACQSYQSTIVEHNQRICVADTGKLIEINSLQNYWHCSISILCKVRAISNLPWLEIIRFQHLP